MSSRSRLRRHSHIQITVAPMLALSACACLADTASMLPAASSELGEVVVSAQRRSESLEKVPMAITAVSGDALTEAGAQSVLDLPKLVPALWVDTSFGAAQPRFSLRGIGNDDYRPSAAPPVAVAIDEVVLNSTYLTGFPFFDVQQVEVLRGPQGTLWGKNTTAGMISITTHKPSEETDAYARYEIGDFGRRKVEAAVGGSLIEGTLSARISILSDKYDGYYRDALTHAALGGSQSNTGRIQLLWTPSSDTDLLISYSNMRVTDNVVYTHVGTGPNGQDAFGYIAPSGPFTVDMNGIPPTTVNIDNFTTRLVHRFVNGLELTNVAAWVKGDSHSYTDDDSSRNIAEVSNIFAHPTQVTEELRLASSPNQAISWIVGGYYLHEDQYAYYDFYAPPFADATGLGGVTLISYNQTTNNSAAFGSVTWKNESGLSATGGLRYTIDRKRSSVDGSLYAQPDSVDWWNLSELTNKSPYIISSLGVDNKVTTWDANLKYQIDPEWMSYLRLAKGFRAATINNLPFSASEYYASHPEDLRSYELGIKGRGLGGRLSLSADAFYYDFRNKQVYQLVGVAGVLADATARVTGVEFDVRYRPTARLELGLAATLQDPKYVHYPNGVVPTILDPSGVTDLSGRQLAKTSKTSGNAFASYDIHVTDKSTLTLRTEWTYTSRFFMRDEAANLGQYNIPAGVSLAQLENLYVQNSFWRGDLNADLTVGPHAIVSGFVRNLTNEYFKTTSFLMDYYSLAAVNYGPPRTFGFAFTYRY